jgi:subtilisin family serine protease
MVAPRFVPLLPVRLPTLLRPALVLAFLAPALLSLRAPPPAAAAEVVEGDAVLGARLTGSIAAGDVHAWRVGLLAGTRLRAELRADDDETPGKDGGSGALPELVVLAPDGVSVVGRAFADADDVRATVATAGTYRFEVRAGTFTGAYELRLDGEVDTPKPERIRVPVEVTGTPVVVHVDAPSAGAVEIEVRRRSGGAPLVAIADALGRPVGAVPRVARASRVKFEEVPLSLSGGLDVTIGAAGGTGTYELRARVRDGADRPEGADEVEDRRVVVQLAPGTDAATFGAQFGWTLVSSAGGVAVYETPEDRGGLEREDADAAEAAPGCLAASPDSIAALPEGSQSNAPVVGSDFGRSDVETQIALQQVRAAEAHAIATGDGVVVAVIDGGFDAGHEFLAGRLLPGRDFVDGDDDPSDELNAIDEDGDGLFDEGYGHGTFVASVVLAAAPGARVLPVRVLDSDGRGLASRVATAILWSVDQGGADVLNLSFGTLGGNRTIVSAVRYALASGVTVVAATGNDGSATVVRVPAATGGVLSVSALDAAGTRAAFANAGAGTSIAAPGADIVGAFPIERYATWSGTSFAAAFASGGAALRLERVPDGSPRQVAAAFARTARPLRAPVPRAVRRSLGAGALDLERLVR